jgi:hypothetical protein
LAANASLSNLAQYPRAMSTMFCSGSPQISLRALCATCAPIVSELATEAMCGVTIRLGARHK